MANFPCDMRSCRPAGNVRTALIQESVGRSGLKKQTLFGGEIPFFHISKRQEKYRMPNIIIIINVAHCCLASLVLTVANSFSGLCDAKHDVCVIIHATKSEGPQ